MADAGFTTHKPQVLALGSFFLLPYLEPHAVFVQTPEEADFVLALNDARPDAVERLVEARTWNRPLAWWTVEDPNYFEAFLDQAALADVVFTTDEACIPQYSRRLGHDRVVWLPLACSPDVHRPMPLAAEATDLVISANWYGFEARRWGVETVVDPLVRAGRSLSLFCLEDFMWPDAYRVYWRGATSFLTVAEQYQFGHVVLGLNNQRYGSATSMRTFEALGCGKPFLAAYCEAYERLGLMHGEHLASVRRPADALAWAEFLLGPAGEQIGSSGREFVLAFHTYAHRLARIGESMIR